MMIPALSLLPFLLATQLVAAATDEQIIRVRLNALSRSLSSQCASNYQYCYRNYISEHQEQQIDYCQAIKDSTSCGLSQNTYNGDTYGPCTENEYERVKEVGCTCKKALDAFRKLEDIVPLLGENCKSKARNCTGQDFDVNIIGATITDDCNTLQKYKQCFISESSPCSQETYDKFEAVACHVDCGGIKITQYSIFLMIITSFLTFL